MLHIQLVNTYMLMCSGLHAGSAHAHAHAHAHDVVVVRQQVDCHLVLLFPAAPPATQRPPHAAAVPLAAQHWANVQIC